MKRRLFKGEVRYKDFLSSDIEQFAKDNGYTYKKSEAVSNESGYYMAPGYYNEKVDIVSWKKGDVEYEFYMRLMNSEAVERLIDTADDVKRSRILLGLVFSAKLPYQLPSVMVQSLTSKAIWNILGIHFLGIGKRVKLEGDFNKFFNVYTPTGEAPNAFLALPPDVMMKMLIAGSGMDFQFAGDRIYFMYDVRIGNGRLTDLWGVMGDSVTYDTRKTMKINQINQKEWFEVFERAKEYSEDIMTAFRQSRHTNEQKSLYYVPLNTKRVVLLAALYILFIAIGVGIIVFYPIALLSLLPLALLVAFRAWQWRIKRKKLIDKWKHGGVKVVVR